MSKRSKTVLGIVLGSALLVGGAGAVAASANSAQPNPFASRTATHASVGDTVQDAQLQFTVTGVDVTTRANGNVAVQRPPGQFVVVRLEVRNLGETRMLPAGAQVLVHGNKPYRAGEASVRGRYNAFASPIRAGGTARGKLVFHVRGNGKPMMLHLRGAPGSQGVKVKLRP